MSSISITGAELNSEVGPDGLVDSPIAIHCAVHCEFAMFTDDEAGWDATTKFASNRYSSTEDSTGRDIVIPSLRQVAGCDKRVQVDVRDTVDNQVYSILYNAGFFQVNSAGCTRTVISTGGYAPPVLTPEPSSLWLLFIGLVIFGVFKRCVMIQNKLMNS